LLAGKAKIMELIASGRVNHSGTYNSNVVSTVAGIASLQVLSENNGSVSTRIETTGRTLMAGLRKLGHKHGLNLYVSGVGAVFNTSFTDQTEVYDYASFKRAQDAPLKALLEGLLERGVRPTSRGTWFVSAAHTNADVLATLAAADAALGDI
jgi:glutamate-1-semialdehyde 2,1-aminomutase